MSPEEFIRSLGQRPPAPAYLFLGPEPYARAECRRALVERVLPPQSRNDGFVRHELDAVSVTDVLDDAQAFSLFATERLIWVSSAEAALPRARGSTSGEESDKPDGAAALDRYLANPVPGVVLVFDCSRFELEGDDKPKIQRIQKYFAKLPEVEFPRFTPAAARKLGASLAKQLRLQIGDNELELLVELLGADASSIANEIEKLSLYAGTERRVTDADIEALSPNTKASTIFALVNALGRNDRVAALQSLDILVREGEYLPLALSFLSTQFRLALAAKEARFQNAGQIQAQFSRAGIAMWRSRAEQVAQTASAFSLPKLRTAIREIHETDKALRDTRPDDRIMMERFVLNLTAA